jgi:hypothetical protein
MKTKHFIAISLGLILLATLLVATRLGAKPAKQPPMRPLVEVAQVEQRDVPIYAEWI